MLARYLKHRKWTRELQIYLKDKETGKCLAEQFLKLELLKVYILADIRNYFVFRMLGDALEKHVGLSVIYIKQPDDSFWNKVDKNSVIVGSEKQKKQAFLNKVSFLTLYDVHNFFVNRQYYAPEIPRIINSIENGYRTVGVAGKGKYVDYLLDYLRDNVNINAVKIEDEQLIICENESVYRYLGKYAVDIIIVPDFRVNKKCVDQTGNVMPIFYWVNLTSTGNSFIGNSFDDIERNVVPHLITKGVKVVWCQAPEATVLPKKAQQKIKRDTVIRNICPKLYSQIRKRELSKENLGYMYGLGKKTRIDCSKGYRECFGNMEHLNYDNGFRRTIGNEAESKQDIWVFGPCLVDPNSRVDDKRTIASVLKEKAGKGYNVYNRGGSFGGMNLLIRNIRYKSGDVVVIFSVGKKENSAATCNLNLTNCYLKIEDLHKHINDSLLHCDSSVIRQIAEDIYEVLEDNKLLDCTERISDEAVCVGNVLKRVPALQMLEEGEFKYYLHRLEKYRDAETDKIIGAIVMNCNPFTLGHRYLIETAARQVDKLYVFVVEEDKSYFPFEARYELVKKGTEDLDNVCVIPSGKYIVSSQTLAGYFEKESIGEIHLDATLDLELFVQIASVLNISKRFAGEEPLDMFTQQYNRNMREVLGAYGIEFVEIKRKEYSGEPISASRVRKLLEQKDFEAIAKIVPSSTYEYCYQRFGENN